MGRIAVHAIIGCGRIAPNHLDAFRFAKEPVKWAVDRNIDKAADFAAKHGIPHFTSNFKEVLQDPEIVSVSICTPHWLHAPMAIQALNSGKHVLTEKPMALSGRDADAMLSAARKNKRLLGVVSQHRYDPLAKEIKTAIADKAFGEIAMVTGTLQCAKDHTYYAGWRGKRSTEGGSTLVNQAIHTLDQMLATCGPASVIAATQAQIKFKGLIETEDTLVSTLRFASGALGALSSTNSSTVEWKSGIEIVGTKGSIGYTTGFPVRITTLKVADASVEERLRALESHREPAPVTQSYYGTSHRAQVEDFLLARDLGSEMHMTAYDARATLKTMLDIYSLTQTKGLDHRSLSLPAVVRD